MPISSLTEIVLAMTLVGYLIMIIGMLTLRSRPAFKPLPPKWSVIIGGLIMLTGMFLPMVQPGTYTWWDYSTPAYFKRLLYAVLSILLFYPLYMKALNRLGLMKKKRS